MTENEISYLIRRSIFKVYNTLGPGLLESAYEAALAYELRKEKLSVQTQVDFPMLYEEIEIGKAYRLDLIVEEKVIVEVKSVENINEVHHKQILTYLKLTGCKLGILVNFNCDDISKSIFRKVNKL